MFDFTFELLEELLAAILRNNYQFITYRDYVERKDIAGKTVILRHDIDAQPSKALRAAQLEEKYGIKGTYYIRCTRQVYNIPVLEKIVQAGHEIGYHYENLSKSNGNVSAAISSFEKHLQSLRTLYPVCTICMHGSPLSRFDNRALWQHFDYRDYGILAELYIDTDFTDIWYATDTGRGWNSKYNIRDKVKSRFTIPVKDTFDLIRLFNTQSLPEQIMITIHPQRWSVNTIDWTQEKISQTFRNLFKITLHKIRQLP